MEWQRLQTQVKAVSGQREGSWLLWLGPGNEKEQQQIGLSHSGENKGE
jgi:hypothetical protein